MENYQSYIESGQLEAYAFGELDAAARAEVEAVAARSPEVRAELDELLAGLGVYAQAHAIAPPAALRERVLGRVLAEIRADQSARAPSAAPVEPVAAPEAAPVVPPPTPTMRVSASNPQNAPTIAAASAAGPYAGQAQRSGWAIAASVALLLSLVGNVLFYNRWQQASSALVAVQSSQDRLAQTTQVMERRLSGSEQQLRVLRSPDFRPVLLAGTKTHPEARARVLYDPAAHRVFLDVARLPALPAGHQYQLWAIVAGKPVDAGMLTAATTTGTGLQQMKDIGSAQAFAMTIEPTGGSLNPTMSTMTVIGNT